MKVSDLWAINARANDIVENKATSVVDKIIWLKYLLKDLPDENYQFRGLRDLVLTHINNLIEQQSNIANAPQVPQEAGPGEPTSEPGPSTDSDQVSTKAPQSVPAKNGKEKGRKA